ncbi:hypothetical protein [Streptomyces sp. NBC_01198]|uniref:hypothetical protein n=1 Tax=Streptomyces sp. NBC_01198 TaxID=2903769 RepID=UPI002E0D3833|nr:hypothetical protein OG702_35155 [Streptomyces sp. NBC_01198]
MRTPADTDTCTTTQDAEGRGPRPPAYGVPSPDLLARADRGFARFLEHVDDQEDQDDQDGGGQG